MSVQSEHEGIDLGATAMRVDRQILGPRGTELQLVIDLC